MGDDFLRQLLVDAFLEHGFLLHQLARSVGVLDFKALRVDLALDQRQLEDLDHRFQLEIGFSGQVDCQFLFLEFEAALAFQVIATVQFLDGVFDGVGDFVFVQFGYHVERRHVISPI
ncbi:Uncharacterised protein [Mycobacterium tuberculosis]|nr:Uncharacterised protein [Mycobacterium tuberculosis]